MGKTLPILAAMLIIFLTGCPEDQSAFQEDNKKLTKNAAKLESFIQSLQEGNKVLQQQIDRLNQEARKTAESYEEQLRVAEATHQEQLRDTQAQMAELANSPKKDAARIKTLEQEHRKLERENNWLRSQRDQMRKALTLHQIGGQSQELPFPYSSASQIIEDALMKNGYSILSSMQTDQKAVYITDRKTSLPPSLELSGFRNQYLLSIEKGPSDHTIIWVRAEFEKLSKNGQMFSAPQSDITDIELRLIQEIHQALSTGAAAQAKNF
ncbi:MAG: hypothetical protein CO149_03875 [Nitrospirae bacterium CG_4_9_14_3_um_filter_51_5]|nr:MAG: hypothetical protein CO149_03875 [Nitrospirae bacterium CG_4_9_14_3_um_filter_51_5]